MCLGGVVVGSEAVDDDVDHDDNHGVGGVPDEPNVYQLQVRYW